jgi:deoxyribodipyrimidine photo-lyase
MDQGVAVWWIRRDLRLDDNQSLLAALNSGYPVLPVFIFDASILEELDPYDHRVEFIIREINRLGIQIHQAGSFLEVYQGSVTDTFQDLSRRYTLKSVYAGRDYEPYSVERDAKAAALFAAHNIGFHLFDDHMILPPFQAVKPDGTPYTVFTAYKNRWLDQYHQSPPPLAKSENDLQGFLPVQKEFKEVGELAGFKRHHFEFPGREFDADLIGKYHQSRDLPAIPGTSRLGVHLRFGTVSVRKLAVLAEKINTTFLNELIWREFYQMILYFHPQVVTRSFKAQYDNIKWLNNEADIQRWCQGNTGYPLVDAGIRELLSTGFMHNRVRMVTASFLTKHLLVDWRIGEAFFARHLLDYELASNNGGWQWAAGTGCDAAPYFRVFNPLLQAAKFDPDNRYIRKWVPESQSNQVNLPKVVEHTFARNRALEVYGRALKF